MFIECWRSGGGEVPLLGDSLCHGQRGEVNYGTTHKGVEEEGRRGGVSSIIVGVNSTICLPFSPSDSFATSAQIVCGDTFFASSAAKQQQQQPLLLVVMNPPSTGRLVRL